MCTGEAAEVGKIIQSMGHGGQHLLRLQFRFQFYSLVWRSRSCKSNWIPICERYKYYILPEKDPITTSQSTWIPSALLLLLLLCHPLVFSNVYPYILYNSGFVFTPPPMSGMFCSSSASLWIHCLLAGKAPVLGWQMGADCKPGSCFPARMIF